MNAQQGNRIGESTVTTIRPSLVTFLIFSAIWLVICLPGIDAVRLGQWQGLLFVLAGGAITVGQVSRYLISWDADELVYRGVFATKRIRFSEIEKFDVHGPVPGKRFGPTLSLRIFSTASGDPVMTINIKPFARRDIARLTERLKLAVTT